MDLPFRRIVAVFCLLALAAGQTVAASVARADDATAAIKKADKLYAQGRLGKAFNELETARTLIARRLSAQYAKTFPPAPGGWRAEAVGYSTKGAHRVGRGLVLHRHYRQNGGKGVATVQINIDQQALIETVQKQHVNPERHAAAARRRLVRVEGVGNAFVRFSEGRRVGNLYAMVADRFYITVSGRNIKSHTFLTKLLSSWNFSALRQTAGAKPAALAADPSAAIRKTGMHYRAAKLGAAFTQAEIAATLIARQLSSSYAKTFPAAPSGWRAKPIQSTIKGKSRAGRTLRLYRDYVQEGGRAVATAQLITDHPRIIAVAKTIKGGPAQAKREKRTAIRIGGIGTAFERFDGTRGTGDLYLFVGDHFYVTIWVRNADSGAILKKLLKGWEFAELKAAAGLR